MPITHVSDTALWVAVHRGQEGLRKDAMYQDPLSLKLAGERGLKIAKKMSSGSFMTWMMGLRTVAIDDLIMKAIEQGVTTVVNLGAGLDTRPYRLNLSKNIKWIEVDFPDMIQYKNEQLVNETPKVSLERISLDLGHKEQAHYFYQTLGTMPGSILVITEGVLLYLTNDQVDALTKELHAIPNIKFWIQDFRHGGYSAGIPKFWLFLKMRFAPFKFQVDNWFEFFAERGWKVKSSVLLQDIAESKNRKMPTSGGIGILTMILPKKKLEEYNRSVGFGMFEKS